MEISDFRTLIALVESGSISAAAARLNRVPSAITTRLQNMESVLETPLFVRLHRRFVPTAEGRMLYEHALKIVALVASAEQQIARPAPGGRFRLGALDSMAATRLPPALAALYRQHQGIAMELTTGVSRSLYDAVLAHELDAAFIANAPSDDRLTRLAVFEEELAIVTAAGHPAVTSPADLARTTLLVFRDGCSYRDCLTAWFHRHRVRPCRLAEMTSYHAILGAVSAGMGVGVIPRSLLATFPAAALIALHPFDAEQSRVSTELVWRTGGKTANIQALIDILAEQGKGGC